MSVQIRSTQAALLPGLKKWGRSGFFEIIGAASDSENLPCPSFSKRRIGSGPTRRKINQVNDVFEKPKSLKITLNQGSTMRG
jgi:hypothetical protein